MDFGIMEISTIEIRKLTASEGMILTNGEAFSSIGGVVYLGKNDSEENWYEITEAECERMLAELEAKILIEAARDGE